VPALGLLLALIWSLLEFGENFVDGREADHIKCLFLVQEGNCPFFTFGIKEVYYHPNVDDVLSSISPRDETPLMVSNFVG
jgi:hypothetical protein